MRYIVKMKKKDQDEDEEPQIFTRVVNGNNDTEAEASAYASVRSVVGETEVTTILIRRLNEQSAEDRILGKRFGM
jgi:hypothetical protein